MIIVDRISEKPGGSAVPQGTPVKLRRQLDDVLLSTANTDPNGWVSFQQNGSPGPVYLEVTLGTETRRRYGQASMQVGTWYEAEWQYYMHLLNAGVIGGTGNSLAVNPGTGMQIIVDTGVGVHSGILGAWYDPDPVAIPSNTSGLTRTDVIGLLFSVGESIEAGKVVLHLHQGANGAGAPVFTNTATEAFLPLAEIRVQNGVSVINVADITDRRTYASSVIPNGSITSSKLAPNSVNASHIVDGSIGNAEIGVNAISAGQLQTASVNGNHLQSDSVTSGHIVNGAITNADIAASTIIGYEKIALGTVVTDNLVDGAVHGTKLLNDGVAESKLAPEVRTKLNAPNAYAPIRLRGRNDTDITISTPQNLLTVGFTPVAGATYALMAIGTVRVTDTSSSTAPRGWIIIKRLGNEIGAEHYYLPGNYSGNGGSVQVLADTQFTMADTAYQSFELYFSPDQGVHTFNQRQILVWIQRIS